MAGAPANNWHVVGRLRDGVSVAQARSDLGGIAHRLKQQYGSDIDMTDARVVPLRESLTGDVRAALLVLLGAVGFLLLVACANLANLQLSQAVAREHEFAVRAALGAGRGRLTRQLLAESALLWLAGGLLGVLVAEWGIQGLMALAPPNLPRLGEVALDFPVLFFAFGISVLIPLSLVVLTAAGATSGDPQRGLAASGRGTSGSLHTQRVSRLIVAGQLAITLTLLAGTVLLGRSLLRLLSLDPGFRTANIVSLDFDLPARHAPGPPFRAASFVNTLFDRLRSIPGIHEVGGTTDLPLTGNFVSDGTFLIVDKPPRSMVDFERLMHTVPTGHADYCIASEGYFGALGIRLISGRLFDDHDTADAPHVAVISESLARATWPKQSPLGKTVEFGNMDGDLRLLRIVGVVADVRDRNLGIPPAPTIYSDYRQRLQGGNNFTVVIHTGARPATVLATARKIVRDLDPDMAPRFRSFQEVFSESLATRRFNLIILAFFAGTALLLAAAGIYGVMAYWVARRTQEIGIRMALGAKRRDVLRLVVGQGLALALLGITTGMVGAFWLTRSMASLLYEIRPTDPASLAEASVLLLIVALLANLIPARRAAKVNPVVALRDQ